VFENHTVFDNLDLSRKGRRRVGEALFRRASKADLESIEEMLVTVSLRERRDSLAGDLSHGQKQWLEIGMLLMQDPELLLVDEPAAGMTDDETAQTSALLKRLAQTRSVVVVEHDMEFVRSLESRVTVLHEGSVLAEGSMDHVQNDARVIEVYLGR
jgi:urea transport system ATP-binding protein